MRASFDVLIVEDDPTICLALAHALKSRGVETHTCTTLPSALDAIRDHAYDVILTDLQMSGQESADGLELLKIVRKDFPDTHVIIMTAYGTDDIETEIQRHGGTYWAKSRDLDELLLSVMAVAPQR